MAIGEALKAQLFDYQRSEITEHPIYRRPAVGGRCLLRTVLGVDV